MITKITNEKMLKEIRRYAFTDNTGKYVENPSIFWLADLGFRPRDEKQQIWTAQFTPWDELGFPEATDEIVDIHVQVGGLVNVVSAYLYSNEETCALVYGGRGDCFDVSILPVE